MRPPANSLRVAVRVPRAMAAWQRRAVEETRRVGGVSLVAVGEETDQASDVLIDFVGGASDEPIRAAPRVGVWRYGFGDGAHLAGGAPGTIARLYQTAGPGDIGTVLREGWFGARTRESPGTADVGARVAGWAARALSGLVAGDLDALDRPPRFIGDTSDALPPKTRWSAADVVATAVFDLRKRERWTLGLVPISWQTLLDRGALPEPAWLIGQPRDRFYADPFPIEITERGVRVLAEDYRFGSGRGHIVDLEIARDGAIRSTREAIVPPGHTSYPFIVRSNERLFCVPEAAWVDSVLTYELDPTTREWQRHGELLAGFAAADPTLVEHEGRWWLFCTNRREEGRTELHVFSAVDWRGPWEPHPQNPVKSDARSSRPAGACVTIDGALYRPAQNCARRYGGGITVNRVIELTRRRFREEPVLAIEARPTWRWPDGIHTINAISDLIVVDGLRVE
jgi:hypothetical protein